MKLNHLIEGYNFNKIPAIIQEEVEKSEEKAGVIKYTDDIYGAYLLDEDGFVCGINIFINSLKQNNKAIKGQVDHSIEAIKIIQKTIELITNLRQQESTSIMNRLGMFTGKLKDKAIRLFNYIYQIKARDGIINFSIITENKDTPPVKSKA